MANLFAKLVKAIAYPFVKASLTNSIEKLERNPEFQKTLESQRYHTEQADKLLESLCKRNPNSVLCKEYFEKYPDRKPKKYNLVHAATFIYDRFENDEKAIVSDKDIFNFLNNKKRLFEFMVANDETNIQLLANILDTQFNKNIKDKIESIEKDYVKSINGTTMFS